MEFNLENIIIISVVALLAIVLCTSLAKLAFDKSNSSSRHDKSMAEAQHNQKFFNAYYINYSKVVEICLLDNNRRTLSSEVTTRDKEYNKMNAGFDVNGYKIGATANQEASTTKAIEYKEMQEVIETKSTYLSEILDKCEVIEDKDNEDVDLFEGLNPGALVWIKNVSLNLENNEKVNQLHIATSGILQGAFQVPMNAGQPFSINLESIQNMLLKNFKYSFSGTIGNKKFFITVPAKPDNELENDYSIYDLETGGVDIIGIYKTSDYSYRDDTILERLQHSDHQSAIGNGLAHSSSSKTNYEKADSDKSAYIDLIAIVQSLHTCEDDNETES